MEIHQLRYFVEVVSCKSYTKAAQHLYVTQPTLTRTINQLEEEFETNLIIRKGKNFQLTKAGEVFYETAEKLLLEYDNLTQKLDEIKNPNRGRVAFAAPYSFLDVYFSNIVSRFNELYPNIELDIYAEYNVKLIMENINNRYDFVIGAYTNDDKPTDCIDLMTDSLSILMNKEHNLSNFERINTEQLSEEKIVMFGEDQAFLDYIRKFRAREEFNVGKMNQISIIRLALEMVDKNESIALMPSSLCHFYKKDSMVVIPFDSDVKWTIGVIWKKDKHKSGSAELFADYLKSYFKNMQE